jgi:hypothetical protein
MQTIKIFLASSSELKEHRKEFREFISVKNDRLHQKGIYLQIIQWEYFLDAVSETRLQEEYNKALKECDVALCMFYSKAGKYTQEEFEVAYKNFKETGKPHIYTYFFNGQVDMQNINVDDLVGLNNFKKRIGELGHFFTLYNSIEELKYLFSEQLDKLFDKWEIELPKKTSEKIVIEIPKIENTTNNNNSMNSLEELKKDLLDKIERQDLPTVFIELEKIYDKMESSEKSTYSQLNNEFKFGGYNFAFVGRLKVFVNGLRLKKNLA